MKQLSSPFAFGDTVYLKTDPDQLARLVIAVSFFATGGVSFQLGSGIDQTWHSEIEISLTKNQGKSLGFKKTEV